MSTRRKNEEQQRRTQQSENARRVQTSRQANGSRPSSEKDEIDGGGRRSAVFTSISFVVIMACLAFGMTVFFRVSDIEIIGNVQYSPNEIIQASGILDGDNLVLMNTLQIEEKIYDELVHIGEVSVERKFPNKVCIEVSESGTVAVIQSGSGFWLIDENCRLIDECNTIDAEKYINVIGVAAVNPRIGEIVRVANEDKAKLNYLIDFLRTIKYRDILQNVSSVNVSNPADAEFDYLAKFTVKLGTMENTDYKIGLLIESVNRLEENETGTFDLSIHREAHFTPNA